MPGAIDPYKLGGTWETGHVFRYKVANGFTNISRNVVDFGCGKGYGSKELEDYGTYLGVDVDENDIRYATDAYASYRSSFEVHDLNSWEYVSPFIYKEMDLAVCFECIEHVENHEHLIGQLKRAQEYIVCSVPIIPTVGINPLHKHDYDYDTLPKMVVDKDWRLYQRVKQQGSDGKDVYGIYVFERIYA